jgi:hypothetical protein
MLAFGHSHEIHRKLPVSKLDLNYQKHSAKCIFHIKTLPKFSKSLHIYVYKELETPYIFVILYTLVCLIVKVASLFSEFEVYKKKMSLLMRSLRHVQTTIHELDGESKLAAIQLKQL